MTRSVTSVVLQRILMKINVLEECLAPKTLKKNKDCVGMVLSLSSMRQTHGLSIQRNIAGVFWICSNGFERFTDLFESDST